MSSSASSTKKREQVYALVSTRGSKQSHRVSLPARIGVTGDNDVIVNVQALADHAFTLSVAGGKLVLSKGAKGEAVGLHTLKNLGLVARGPIKGGAQGRRAVRLAREVLGREKAWFQGLPLVAQRWLGGGLPQGLRLAAWTSAVAALGALVLIAPETKIPDLSKEPVEFAFDTVKGDTFGANPKNADFPRGYEKGITFEVEVPKEQKGHPLVLSFRVAGLNIGKEIQLKVNGKQVYESAAETDCAQDVCAKSVRIDGALVKGGLNKLFFQHNEPQSSYFVAKLHLRPLPALNDLEREQLDHWLELAQRAYDERSIVPENLVTAKTYVAKLDKLASERDGVGEIAAKAQILAGEVDKAFAATVQEYWTAYATADKLGNKLDTEQALNQLLKLYPDARSEEHADVMEKLEALKEPKQ